MIRSTEIGTVPFFPKRALAGLFLFLGAAFPACRSEGAAAAAPPRPVRVPSAEADLLSLEIPLLPDAGGVVRLGPFLRDLSREKRVDLLVDPGLLPAAELDGVPCPFAGPSIPLRLALDGIAEELDAEYLVLPGRTVWLSRGAAAPGEASEIRVHIVKQFMEPGRADLFARKVGDLVRPLEPSLGAIRVTAQEDALTLTVAAHPLVQEEVEAVLEGLDRPDAELPSPAPAGEASPPGPDPAEEKILVLPGPTLADLLRAFSGRSGLSVAWDPRLERTRCRLERGERTVEEFARAAVPGGLAARAEAGALRLFPAGDPPRATREAPAGRDGVRVFSLAPSLPRLQGADPALVADLLSARAVRRVRLARRGYGSVAFFPETNRVVLIGPAPFLEEAESDLASLLARWPAPMFEEGGR